MRPRFIVKARVSGEKAASQYIRFLLLQPMIKYIANSESNLRQAVLYRSPESTTEQKIVI